MRIASSLHPRALPPGCHTKFMKRHRMVCRWWRRTCCAGNSGGRMGSAGRRRHRFGGVRGPRRGAVSPGGALDPYPASVAARIGAEWGLRRLSEWWGRFGVIQSRPFSFDTVFPIDMAALIRPAGTFATVRRQFPPLQTRIGQTRFGHRFAHTLAQTRFTRSSGPPVPG